MAVDGTYTGIENLEVMEVAHRYRDFLVRAVTGTVGGPARAGRLLDFGSGTGTIARPLHDLGYDVSCVELDPALLERLQAAGIEATADVHDHTPASFDAVCSMNVLEHIEDDGAALTELHRVLRPGGRLVLYVPALGSLFSAMDRKVGHLRRYRRTPLERLVTAAGFCVDRCRYVDSLGALAALAYKVVGSRDGDLSERSVAAYDRFGFPVSRALDRLTGRVAGKNLLLVATATGSRHVEGSHVPPNVPRSRAGRPR